MNREMRDLLDHLERHRAVTLQLIDALDESELNWRPSPQQYSVAQQLLHIAQTESFYTYGLFDDDWNFERSRFPKVLPTRDQLKQIFAESRQALVSRLLALDPAELDRVVAIVGTPVEYTLRSWLWYVLEHEVHHKAQLSAYFRQIGKVPPFWSIALAPGTRPDIQRREDLGGI